MSELQTHDITDLRRVGDYNACPSTIEPGQLVSHQQDDKSFGMCVSRHSHPDKERIQCEVVWTKQPVPLVNIQIQSINAASRQLAATWTIDSANTIYAGNTELFDKTLSPQMFVGEEEHELHTMSKEEIVELRMAGHDVTFDYSRETVVVKKRTNVLPDYLSDKQKQYILKR